MTIELSQNDRLILLKIAREAIQGNLDGKGLPEIQLEDYSPSLQEAGASFVTLTKKGMLRGCVGSIEARQPLVIDVRERAIGAAIHDHRFPKLELIELSEVRIEISRLTPPKQISYSSPDELTKTLRPGCDGVILRYQNRKATFLPQVWEQLSDPETFLDRLCLKMGLDQSSWKTLDLRVDIYQVEKFQE